MKFIFTLLVLSLRVHAGIQAGQWEVSCQSGLKKEQIYGSNNQVISTESFFEDAFCEKTAFVFQTVGFVEYPESSEEQIDFQYKEIYLSIFKLNVVEDFNARQVCGLTDWQLGQAQNITGLECEIFNINKPTRIPAAGNKKYGIYRVNADRLVYGQLSREYDGSTPQKRPIDLNLTTEYIFRKSF